MPSLAHEGLVLLFRNAPELAAALLRDVLHAHLPPFEHVRIGEADVSQLLPATFTTDLVILLEHGERKPSCAIIVEPQLGIDAAKRSSWPVYVCGVRAKFGCDVVLLVVTLEESVARWAKKPIAIGHPGFELTPLVLGPEHVPVVATSHEAVRQPELAVLSVLAHGKTQGDERALAMAKSALVACDGLEGDRALSYAELVFQSLNAVARATLEKIMSTQPSKFQGEFAQMLQRIGRAQGREEGRVEGEAKALVTVLEARGLHVPDDVRERIMACTDFETLNGWLRKAATASSLAELFRD